MTKRGKIIAAFVCLVFLGFAGYSFSSALNPYVSFAQAKSQAGTVQVMGFIDERSIQYQASINQLSFAMTDEDGYLAQVVYQGVKPNNLEHADSVVVVGSFDGDIFRAGRLLVKCPSKYEDGGDGQ